MADKKNKKDELSSAVFGLQDSSSGGVPRQSNRVGLDKAPADGDTWHESLSVCEGATLAGTPRLIVRSYFRNERTQQRVWDEPPSGASNVKFASADKRARAQAKMTELQLTLDMIPPDDSAEALQRLPTASPKKGNKKGGFFRKLSMKKKEKPIYQINESQDVNLQKAIARSMADMNGRPDDDEPVVYFDTETPTKLKGRTSAAAPSGSDDDDMALAKALSMSENAAKDVSTLSEEEQLLMVLEQSRIEVEGPGAFASADPDPPIPAVVTTLSEDDMNRKMPAVERKNPFESPPPSPSKIASVFDPYSPTFEASPVATKPQHTTHDLQLLAMPLSGDIDLLAIESRQEALEDGQNGKAKRNIGRLFAGNRRKSIEDEAGVV